MHSGFLILWCLASAGAAKWLAVGENALHGLGWRRPVLQRVRTVHNLLLCGYPLLFFFGLGWFGPAVLWTGNWAAIPMWGWGLISFGLSGVFVLGASTIRYCTTRPPVCQIEARTQRLDVRQMTPAPLIGDGRARWLARLPCNEQLLLDVHQRTYELPRLPAAWDGVSIVHFSDCHFRGPITRDYFEQVLDQVQRLQGDLIAFTGDLLDHKRCLDWIPDTFGRLSAPQGCYFVLGNHDWYLGIEAETRAALQHLGWIDIAGRTQTLERQDTPLVVCGNERPWLGTLPDLSQVSPSTFRVLLSHSPDQIAWARRAGIDLMLAGHTHGGQIRLPLIGPVYAPSLYGCRYASGVFDESPTLLSVTQGVSGREPIRYNCPPEIIKLTLRSASPRAGSASARDVP